MEWREGLGRREGQGGRMRELCLEKFIDCFETGDEFRKEKDCLFQAMKLHECFKTL